MEQIWIGKEIHSLNNMIRRYFESSPAKKEIEEVTSNNGWIIRYLSENEDHDIYQKDLEEHFTIARSTASRVLGLMEEKGMIRRLPVARDARLKKIVLTDKSRKILNLMCRDAEWMEQSLVKDFSEEEEKTLCSYIQRMKDNISSERPAR